MGNTLNSYLEKNIPFALFRAPGQHIRFVAQLSSLNLNPDFQQPGFHFAPFSGREKVPYIIIKNDVDVLLENSDYNYLPNTDTLNIPKKIKRSFLFSNKNPRNDGQVSPPIEKSVSPKEYKKDLQTYFDFFEKNGTRKAIYSRLKNTNLPEDFELFSFFEKIEKAYSRALVYLVHLPGIGLWAGASPETLLKYKDGIAETVALAGTQKIIDGQNVEDLTWGKKEIEEHQMVADYIFEKIKTNNLQVLERSKTYTSQAGTMAHLKQRYKFKITKNQLPDFIKHLRPTPAVCGLPKEKALELIYATEPYDRQYYAGYLGMVEENDTVDFYVNLRCMKIYNNKATLFVGGGITANSNPQKEWEETELKAKTLLNILDLIEV